MSITEKTYTVEGMTCAHCERSVREEVEEIDDVEWSTADHITGRVTLRGTDVNDEDVRAAVEEAGYTIRSVVDEPTT